MPEVKWLELSLRPLSDFRTCWWQTIPAVLKNNKSPRPSRWYSTFKIAERTVHHAPGVSIVQPLPLQGTISSNVAPPELEQNGK